jgi:hypothetical protein
MGLDIDNKYSALSSLVSSQSNGRYNLYKLGKGAQNLGDRYLNLSYCCYEIINNAPRWPAGDSYNYLSTLDAFAKNINNDTNTCKKFYDKLIKRGSESAFLDTIVEATWAVYFWNSGFVPVLEKPFDPTNPHSKDADLVISLNGIEYWLDILSVDLDGSNSSGVKLANSTIGRPSREGLLAELTKRSKRKYDKKFKNAVRMELLKTAHVGVLLCIFKSDKYIIPSFFPDLEEGIDFPPPAKLFGNQRPRLNLIWVHTLRLNKTSYAYYAFC